MEGLKYKGLTYILLLPKEMTYPSHLEPVRYQITYTKETRFTYLKRSETNPNERRRR